ncbi:MAG: hypothetical protein KDD82_31080 [Planctomycetes bacterium]|nr:hypothetical protein [Planctomycetota bacterium]
MRAALLGVVCLAFAGCRTVVETPPAADDPAARAQVYQRIADSLPDADLGLGYPPAIVDMTASARAEGPAPEPPPLRCNEQGFQVHFRVYRPRALWIPYSALEEISYRWKPFPNVVLAPLLIVPLQAVETTLVIDARGLGVLDKIEADCTRLERVSREVGLGGAAAHADGVRWKLEEDAANYGPGRLVMTFDYLVPYPAWIPVGGPARETAEAYAWARAHPTEKLQDEAFYGQPDPAEPSAEDPPAEDGE